MICYQGSPNSSLALYSSICCPILLYWGIIALNMIPFLSSNIFTEICTKAHDSKKIAKRCKSFHFIYDLSTRISHYLANKLTKVFDMRRSCSSKAALCCSCFSFFFVIFPLAGTYMIWGRTGDFAREVSLGTHYISPQYIYAFG